MSRLILAALLILVGISAPKAQLSMMGVGGGNLGGPSVSTCSSGSLMNGIFDLTNTCNDIYFIGALK